MNYFIEIEKISMSMTLYFFLLTAFIVIIENECLCLLNLLHELMKSDKMQSLLSIYNFLHNKFNNFNNTGA